MADREEDCRLTAIWDNDGKTYSISKLNTIYQCQYQAYLTYIAKKEQVNNCWAILGSAIHDCIEKCINAQNENIMSEAFFKDTIKNELKKLEMLDLKFPKDRKGGTSIRDNWIANMNYFSEHFVIPKGKFITEQLIVFPIKDDVFMMGYIDAIRINDDGSLYIIDWKTSSNFSSAHLLEAGRQLITYALGKEHEGFKVNKVSWCMLKYCITEWKLKNGKTQAKISEWRNYIIDLKKQLEKALFEMGYNELEVDSFMTDALQNNNLNNMPDKIKEKFTTNIYVREYKITQELRQECMEYINKSIELYESLGEDEKNWKPCNIAKNSFFCSSLCGHSKHCKYYQSYLDKQLNKQNTNKDMYLNLFS